MIKVNLSEIEWLTPEDAYYLTGVEEEDFAEPGTYHVVIGSRGVVESFEFLGEVDTIEVPTVEELINDSDIDDEDRGSFEEMLEEFYGVNVEDDHVNFAFTEEGYDVWLKIA